MPGVSVAGLMSTTMSTSGASRRTVGTSARMENSSCTLAISDIRPAAGAPTSTHISPIGLTVYFSESGVKWCG